MVISCLSQMYPSDNAKGAIILAYPEHSKRGRYLALWSAFKNMGQVVGGSVSLKANMTKVFIRPPAPLTLALMPKPLLGARSHITHYLFLLSFKSSVFRPLSLSLDRRGFNERIEHL